MSRSRRSQLENPSIEIWISSVRARPAAGEPAPRDDDLVRRPDSCGRSPPPSCSALALLVAIALPALRAKREEAMQE